jgi:cysteine desulfurase
VSAVVGILVPVLYLDHAATTPLRPEAAAAMAPYLEGEFGNPSGMHAVSRRAKNAIEEARERVAAVVGAHPLDVVFTGAGTESDNLAVAGVALAGGRRGGVVTTAIEHEAVLATAHHLERLGCPLTIVPVDQYGVVDPERVRDAVAASTAVVSVMAANNETGAVQPVAAIAEAVAGRGALLHSDAVQAAVSRPCSLDDLGVDLLTLSAHKLGGPQGVGILALRPGIALEPVIHAAGRSGTAQRTQRRRDRQRRRSARGGGRSRRLVDDVTAAQQRFESGLTSVVSGGVYRRRRRPSRPAQPPPVPRYRRRDPAGAP